MQTAIFFVGLAKIEDKFGQEWRCGKVRGCGIFVIRESAFACGSLCECPNPHQLTYNGIIPMKSRSIPSFLALSGVPNYGRCGAAMGHQSPLWVSASPIRAHFALGNRYRRTRRFRPPPTLARRDPGIRHLHRGCATHHHTAENQSGIANVVGYHRRSGAAQISGRQSHLRAGKWVLLTTFLSVLPSTFRRSPRQCDQLRRELVLGGPHSAVEWDNAGGLNGLQLGPWLHRLRCAQACNGFMPPRCIGGERNPASRHIEQRMGTTPLISPASCSRKPIGRASHYAFTPSIQHAHRIGNSLLSFANTQMVPWS